MQLNPLALALSTAGGSRFTPLNLFFGGIQGMWYDYNDLSTLFTDSAGTIPATWGDPIGRQLDKSQGLANLLLYTSNFSAGVDSFTGTRGAAAGNIDGIGGEDDWLRLTLDTTNNDHFLQRDGLFEVGRTYTITYKYFIPAGQTVVNAIRAFNAASISIGSVKTVNGTTTTVTDTFTAVATSLRFYATNGSTLVIQDAGGDDVIYVKEITVRTIAGNHRIQSTSGSRPILGRMPKRGRINELVATATMATQNVTVTNAQRTLSFTGTGTVTLSGVSTAGPLVGTGVNNRVSLTFTPTAGTLTLTVSGSVTLAQLQLGAAFDNYQAVGATAFDITESGQPSCGYLSYNGTNQWMQTAAAVNFSATDEMSVFAGVRKVADGATGFVCEHTADSGSLSGSFGLAMPTGVAVNSFNYVSRGSVGSQNALANSLPSPVSAVITCLSEISADTNTTRRNSVLVQSVTTDQGAGNYANAVTYFGARAGTSLYFNGLEFSTIIRGASTSGTLLTRTEQYVARQTPTVDL